MEERKKRKRHKNSRNGCANCKQKRVKCGEELPSCYNCSEKNLVCSFLSLSEEDKQKLQGSQKNVTADPWDPEIYELIARGQTFLTDRFSYRMLLPVYELPPEKELSSTLSFGEAPETRMKKRKVGQGSPGELAVALGSSQALPGAQSLRWTFRLHKLTRNKRFFDSPAPTDIFTVCGENLPFFAWRRRGISNWYQLLIDYGVQLLLLFHQDMLLLLLIILGKCNGAQAASLKTLRRCALEHKVQGLKLAQSVIDMLNMPLRILGREYVTCVHKIIAYLMVNVGTLAVGDQAYHTFTAFTGGFMLVLLTKQIVERFRTVISEGLKDGPHDHPIEFLRFIFPFIHTHYLGVIKLLYMPPQGAGVIHELADDLRQFLSVTNLDLPMRALMEALHTLLSDPYFRMPMNQDHVLAHDPASVFRIFLRFLSKYQPKAMFMLSNHLRMLPLDKICCLYWVATCSALDVVFPEMEYVFTLRFSGIVRFSGVKFDVVLRLLLELQQGPQAEYYMRRVIYLVRYILYLSYRWQMWREGTIVKTPYPKSPLFDKVRFKLRRLDFVEEDRLSGLKTNLVQKQNYPFNKKIYVDDNSPEGRARPNHRCNVSFTDTGLDMNTHVTPEYDQFQAALQAEGSFNVDTFPLQYMRLLKWGLLENLDFRPDIPPLETRLLDERFFSKNEIMLNDFMVDWRALGSAQ